jgi:integrase
MPRPRPPFLLRERNRHGRLVWYVRKGDGPRTRIPGEFGTDAFMRAYRAAVDGVIAAPAAAPKIKTGSLNWLWDRYRETTAWSGLSDATRRARENIMDRVMKTAGTDPYGSITTATVELGRERRSATPAAARNFLDAMRGLFRWARAAQHVTVDPTFGVTNPKRKKGPGFPAWNEEDVARYQAKWPIGTKERLWLDLLLYTGPRRGDVVKLGRQHVSTVYDKAIDAWIKVISFKTEKGGELIEVTIPILPVLQVTLDAGPCSDLAFICGDNSTPLTKESFGNMFRTACDAAKVFGKSAHGVRKIAATTAADNGATIHQLMAIFGWKTTQMAELYTREANRKRLAREAAHMLGGRNLLIGTGTG